MRWTFGCDSWLFADGVYDHIEVGEPLRASIEYWSTKPLVVSTEPLAMSVEPVGPRRYRVCAVVVEAGDFIVLDLDGLHVSRWAAPMSQSDDLRVGDVVTGIVHLALNPFDDVPGAERRRRTWTVDSITRERGDRRRPEITSIQLLDGATVDDLSSYVIGCQAVSQGDPSPRATP